MFLDCSDHWELVHRKHGPVCWALVPFPENMKGHTTEEICAFTHSEEADVRNPAEKSILAELTKRTDKPALTCYKASQFSLEDDYKTVDYERPPEYIRKVNEDGVVRLKKGIAKEDVITIGFSFKLVKPHPRNTNVWQSVRIRIRNSSDPGNYSVEVYCYSEGRSGTLRKCTLNHPGMQKSVEVVTPTYFFAVAKIWNLVFDFVDKQSVKVFDERLEIPTEYSFLGMDEISVENVTVARLEHSKKCRQKLENGYEFERRNLPVPKLPNLDLNNIPVRRRSFGSNYSFVMPNSYYDFYDEFAKDRLKHNPVVFDIRMYQTGKKDMNVSFWNHRDNRESYRLELKDRGLYLTYWKTYSEEKTVRMGKASGKEAYGNPLANLRVNLTTLYHMMDISTTYMYVGTTDKDSSPHEPTHYSVDEIRLASSSGLFYEAKLTFPSEFIMKTCNFRPISVEDMDERVPFRPKCIHETKVLCERAVDLGHEEPIWEEEREERVWGEERVQTSTEEESTTTMAVQQLEVVESEEEEEEEEEKVTVDNIDGLQWCVVSLTSLSVGASIAVVILNFVRWV
ncbi:unnamed protein product [Caenorhabditis sp. 36 PRJEB53466]|nr:unnamed protein product [Caenorhabditis sp. 36 PRJEB53466]